MARLSNRKYKRIENIGEGGFGIVTEVESNDGNRYAIKINFGFKKVEGMLSLRDVNFSTAINQHPYFLAIKEISLKDPFTTKYIPKFKNKHDLIDELKVDSLYFVMSLGKSSLDCLFKKERYEELIPRFRSIIWQITVAIEYMHAKNFMHRDIKPDNIIIFTDKNNDFRVKIADFGFIKTCSNDLNTVNIQNHSYRAPEIALKCKNYKNTVDIWSLGIIFFQMLTGGDFPYSEEPNKNDNDEKLLSMMHLVFNLSSIDYVDYDRKMYEKIVRKPSSNTLLSKLNTKMRDPINSKLFDYFYKDECFDLLINMLNPNIGRFTANQCLNHPFFSKNYPESKTDFVNMHKTISEKYCISPTGDLIPECEDLIVATDNPCRQKYFKYAEYIYNSLNGQPWFNLQIWASTNDLFDRWLYHYLNTSAPTIIPTEHLIKKCYFSCAFIMIKTCSTEILSFNDIFPNIFDEEREVLTKYNISDINEIKDKTLFKIVLDEINEVIKPRINEIIKMEQELVFQIAKGHICRFTIMDFITHDQIDINKIMTLLLDDLPTYHDKSWKWLTKKYLEN